MSKKRSVYDDMFEGTGMRSDDDSVAYEGCRCVRESEKALLVRFPEGDERWVPKSQLRDGTEVSAAGDEGALEVSSFIGEKIDEEREATSGKPNHVAIKGCVVMRESEKALLVQFDGDEGTECWIPKSHVAPDSEVTGDGDVGTIRVSQWIANEKGLGGKQPEQKKAPPRREQQSFKTEAADPDDDDNKLPF